jgi:CPA1 family monovalent cation:H+ antiporter
VAVSFFALVSLLIALAAVSSYVNYRYIKLPTTIGVMLVALVASLALVLVGPFAGGIRGRAAAMVSRIDFDQVVLHGMLAFLLFAAAIHVSLEDLVREWLAVGALAVFGTLASTFIVGSMTWLVLGWLGMGIPLVQALLFGALISPTDPIATLGIMKSVHAPKQLEVQIAGESLFNDGLGVVVFLTLLHIAGLNGAGGDHVTTPLSLQIRAVGLLLIKEVLGAVLLALAVGFITYRMLKRVDNYQVEVMLTLALAMGLYALADAIHLSAPIAVVVAGLFVGNQGRTFAMSEKTREHVDTFWELVDEILNVVLFLLMGLELLVLPIEGRGLLAGVLAIPIVLGARWLSVAGILNVVGRVKARSKGATTILTWGGLRGGISVAMALSLPATPSRSLVLTLTYSVVVFSILVQGLTVGRLVRLMRGQTTADGVDG